MARMGSRGERRIRKTAGAVGRAILTGMEVEEAITSPHKTAIRIVAEKMAKADKVPMRRGPVRERYQVYNPRIGKWVKYDSRTGRIVGVKKDGLPYKGVRKKRRGRK